MDRLKPLEIRELRSEAPNLRDRDFADQNNISEAALAAAYVGATATRIEAHPDHIMAAAEQFGEVMALTRTPSCVHEKVGVYENYHTGSHAAMVLTEDIDLRIFPRHWCHAFAIEKKTDAGVQHSLQVFDAAGDAVHKIFLRPGSKTDNWPAIKSAITLDNQSQIFDDAPREPVEAAKSAPAKRDVLRKEWARLTDTHQFLRLCSKLKMNRLGAYRIAGTPFVRPLAPQAANQMLEAVQAAGLEIMLFVGNKGCIQIHTGPLETLRSIGPWQNVMDPKFNLHLRLDHIAEVWAVEKPTHRGPAVSVEAFDKDGMMIFQTFGLGKEGRDSRPAWGKLVEGLEGLPEEALT